MPVYRADDNKIVYAGRTFTSIAGAAQPPMNSEDRAGAKGVANGGIIFIIGSDETGECKVPIPVAAADHEFMVDAANRLYRGEKVNNKAVPTFEFTDLNSGIVSSMPALPKKIPLPEHAGFGEGPGDPPISEWEFVGGPVTVKQTFIP